MNSRRYACAVIPDFPIAVWIYQDPMLANRPIAIAETEKDASPLMICSAEALEAGISAAMTASQAHSRCPDLIIKLRDHKKETELSGLIVKRLQTLSPLVEEDGTWTGRQAGTPDGTDRPLLRAKSRSASPSHAEDNPGIFFLDASGLRFIYRDEAEFGEKIIATINALGFPVRVGIAGNKFTAHVAAISSPLLQPTSRQAEAPDGTVKPLLRAKSRSDTLQHVTIVPSGSEPEFLTNLPVEHLPLAEETRDKLRDLGLKQIGQLTVFTANEITERFGAEGTLLSQLAAGIDRSFFLPDTPVEPISQTAPFIFSIADSGMLIAHTEQLLVDMLHHLQRSGQACTTFTLICRLADKSTIPFAITLDRPSAAPALFIRQLRLTLEKTVLPSPVTEITVTIPEPIPLIMEQTELQRKAGGSTHTQKFPSALKMQSSMYTPEIHETHLPETAFRLAPVRFPQRVRKREQFEQQQHRSQTFTGHAVTGLRLLQPPFASKVVTERGRTLLWTALKQLPVARKQGPWKLSGSWWSGPFDRFYYEMQTVDRQCYLVYFDRLMSQWFVQGVFD